MRIRKLREQRLQADAWPRAEFCNSSRPAFLAGAGLLYRPSAEFTVGPCHAVSNEPAQWPVWASELPRDDGHLLPPLDGAALPCAGIRRR